MPLPAVTVPVVDLNDIEAVCELLLAQAIPVEHLKERVGAV
jgi:hypothetical protein